MTAYAPGIWLLEINETVSILYNKNINQVRLIVEKEVKSIMDVESDYTLAAFATYVDGIRDTFNN